MFRLLIIIAFTQLFTASAKTRIPVLFKQIAQYHDLSPNLVMEKALLASGVIKNGNQVVWPWTVIENGEKKYFKTQKHLIEHIQQLSSFNNVLVGIFNIDISNVSELNAIRLTNPETNIHKWASTFKKETKSNYLSTKQQSLKVIINKIALEEGIDPKLIHAVIQQESAYNPSAISHAGAVGLMQIMPQTGMELGISNIEDLLNPEKNVRAGITYLKTQILNFNRLDYALAAYNAGPGAVNKYGGIPPYKETKKYVKRILQSYNKLKEIKHG